jgi:NCS1 family nucleobase:cation symporter-1
MDTFAVNTLANLLPPAYDLSNIFPKKITWFRGVLLATLVGILVGAWSFLGSAYGFMVSWLLTYGTALGSIVGINIADYVFIRKFYIDIDSLFTTRGVYKYLKGFNPSAFLAFGISVLIGYLSDLGIKNVITLYIGSLGPLVTLPLSIILYLIFMKLFKNY